MAGGSLPYWRALVAALLLAVALHAAKGPTVIAQHMAELPQTGPVLSPELSASPSPRPAEEPEIEAYDLPASAPWTPVTPNPRIVLAAQTPEPLVALTFDLDLSPQMLAAVRSGAVPAWINQEGLSLLEATGTRATLFMTGLWAELYPDLARELAAMPQFEIGNHSYSHPAFHLPCYRLAGLGAGGAALELQRSQETIERITGVRPRYFRFPGGCYDSAALDAVHAAGLVPIQWNVVSLDAFNSDAGQIATRVLSSVRPGSIVVMHLMGGPNAPASGTALRSIIPGLAAQGYRFVTVGELLALAPAVEPSDPREVVEAAVPIRRYR